VIVEREKAPDARGIVVAQVAHEVWASIESVLVQHTTCIKVAYGIGA
jgi:hypothetical protein